jgi:hypothetical protein
MLITMENKILYIEEMIDKLGKYSVPIKAEVEQFK